jgi:hypothetical protein
MDEKRRGSCVPRSVTRSGEMSLLRKRCFILNTQNKDCILYVCNLFVKSSLAFWINNCRLQSYVGVKTVLEHFGRLPKTFQVTLVPQRFTIARLAVEAARSLLGISLSTTDMDFNTCIHAVALFLNDWTGKCFFGACPFYVTFRIPNFFSAKPKIVFLKLCILCVPNVGITSAVND